MPNSKPRASNNQPLRIGIVGGGVVGGGVCEILMGSSRLPHLCRPVHITKICVKDLSKPRSFHLSDSSSLVTDVNSILNDDSIDVVVELVGGTTFAKTVVLEGIKRGKSVVTANKELIAKHVTEMCTDPCH